MFKRVLMLTAVVLVFSVCQVQADTVTWDGEAAPGDNGWNRAENWDSDVVPGVSDNVVINMGTEEDEEEIQLQHPDFTIDSLDISGYVGLGAWGLHWIGITITNGLVNNGILEIYTDGWIGLYADVTNATGARLELERIDIEGTFTNENGATVEIWDEAEFIGDLDNYGTIEVDPFSEMWVEGTLYNDSLIQLYGGDAEIEGTLENDENGIIKGRGLIGADETFINSGEIIAEGGTLVLYAEGTFENTGVLSNEFVSSLQIGAVADVENYGTINVNAGGGVAFDCNLVNASGEADGIIKLLGGTLAARNITHSAGAMLYGFGTITTNELLLESGTDPEFTGPTNIVGNLKVANGATLIISAGLTLITGQTTNNGTILLAGGTVIFEGGLSGSGEVFVPPAGDNVALNKAASQSSTILGGSADRAVDGDTDGEWANHSVTHTNGETHPWWQVDLGATYNVNAIELWNRTGSTKERLDDFYVFVSDTPFASTDLTATLNESGVWSRHVTAVPDPHFLLLVGQAGRYVRIQLGDTNYLNLAEVKVFGEVFVPSGDNVALNKAASQSSTALGGSADRAVDGDTDGEWANHSVTHTNWETHPWWQVDLGAAYNISTIEVWNRTGSTKERLDDFYVFVSDTPFASTDLTATLNDGGVWSRHVTTVPDPQFLLLVGRIGRYVRIQLGDTNYLNLAEVKVFSEVF